MNESNSLDQNNHAADEDGLIHSSVVTSLAAHLVQVRTRLGHTQDDLLENIRCTPSIAEAIEQGDVTRIGGKVFARGYYKRYAEWLGEEVDAELYVAAMDALKPQNNLKNYVPTTTQGRHDVFHGLFRRAMYIAMTAALVFPAYLALKHQLPEPIRAPVVLDQTDQNNQPSVSAATGVNGDATEMQVIESADRGPMMASFTPNRSNQWHEPLVRTEVVPKTPLVLADEQQVVASEPVALASGVNTSNEPQVATDQSTANQDGQLVLTVTVDSWMKFTGKGGQSLLSRVVKPGETLTFSANEVQNMIIGNAEGVELSLNDQAVDLSSFKRGNVAKVSMAKLKQAAE